MELETKYGTIKIFAKTIENEAIAQIIKMANSPVAENANIRIMPDCHAGVSCTIGTTMKVTDKVCPNLVGVDIGCGVDLVKTNINFENNLEKLDNIIREKIPFGKAIHKNAQKFDLSDLKCWKHLFKDIQDSAKRSLGSLGGGNHFIEAYKDGYLAVHSGSRNLGYGVAKYYQKLAKQTCFKNLSEERLQEVKKVESEKQEKWLKEHQINFEEDLAYLTGSNLDDYLHDIKIIQEFAIKNRSLILENIVKGFGGRIEKQITSTHNYIDTNSMILRKGAISAKKDEVLIIPLNMRDGLLICKGKGNPEWNYSAPHGAGRLYSRAMSKEIFSVEEYEKEMNGIFTTCINESTLDEAPFVYKNYKEIMECIEPTVDIIERLIPIYNFKAN